MGVVKTVTLKEFCKKYGVSYYTAYNATYRVKPFPSDGREQEYPERELVREVHRIACERIQYHRRAMDRNIEIKERMEGVW